MEWNWTKALILLYLSLAITSVRAWTGEIHGRVVCDVCGDSSVGPEDHVLEGAEVAVLCITKSGEVLNYQAFSNSNGIYTVAETMPESDRWDACLARPISSSMNTAHIWEMAVLVLSSATIMFQAIHILSNRLFIVHSSSQPTAYE